MQSSKHLYNQIMRRISNSVKHILNEDMHNFDVADYEDDGIIDSHTIHTIVYYKYFPETRNDLKELVIKRVKQNPQNPYLLDIDTSKITSMHELFWDGGSSIFDKIEELDLSGWNTSNVTDMSHMFLGLKKLKKLDISNFNTSNVYNMESMFLGNYCLTELDLSSFDTSNVLDMSSMFKWCGKLMELDLSHFNTSKTTNMENMFCGCKSLTELDLSSFDTSKITSLFYMFNECKSLKKLDLSNFDTSNVTTMYCVFLDCKSLKTLNLSNWDTLNVTDMYNMFSGCRSLKEINLVHFDTRNVKRMDEMFAGCRSLKKLDLSNFNTCNVTTMHYMFSGCYKLSELNLANWNTSNVTDMRHMFGDCKLLKELDLSSFTVPHYYIVNHMFDGCDSLTYINTNNRSIKYAFKNKRILNEDLLNFNVTDYGDEDIIDRHTITNYTYTHFPKKTHELYALVFERVKENPEEPYLLDIDTSKITDMNHLFNGYTNKLYRKIKKLNLSSWNTSNVRDMNSMFSWCYSLTELNLSNFDTSNVEDMYGMFLRCTSLVKLDISNFNTSEVTEMGYMFGVCESLKELDLSNFNTSNVESMFCMFDGCSLLTKLDLSMWNISNVENMENMFANCSSLIELNLPYSKMLKPYTIDKIFNGCTSLSYMTTNSRKIKKAFKELKLSLNEDILNFDVVNYGDDDVIDNQEINNIISEMSEEKIEYIIEFTKLMMYDSGGTVHKKINKRFEIYNDFIYNETNNDIKAKKNIFDDPYYWEEVGAGDILDPKHKYKSGISYYINLSYEDKKLIMDAVNPVISDYLLKGFDFSENIKKDKNLFSKLVFELGNLFSRQEYNDRIYVYLHEQTKEIVIENMEYVYMNITSGLEQFDFYGYKILLPVECNIEVSDSYSSSMNIRKVKEAILKVFSRKNKFGIITLKYISFHMSDMGLDFLDKIYADKVEFSTCSGFRTLNIDSRTFINPNTKLEIIAGSGKLKI